MSTERRVYYTRRGNSISGPHSAAEIAQRSGNGQLLQSDDLLVTAGIVPAAEVADAPGWTRAGCFGTLKFAPAEPPAQASQPRYQSPAPNTDQRVILVGIDIKLRNLVELQIEWLISLIIAGLIVFSPVLVILIAILIFGIAGR